MYNLNTSTIPIVVHKVIPQHLAKHTVYIIYFFIMNTTANIFLVKHTAYIYIYLYNEYHSEYIFGSQGYYTNRASARSPVYIRTYDSTVPPFST
jgi:hypothetical protein